MDALFIFPSVLFLKSLDFCRTRCWVCCFSTEQKGDFYFFFYSLNKRSHFFPPYAVLLILWVSLGHDIWPPNRFHWLLIGFDRQSVWMCSSITFAHPHLSFSSFSGSLQEVIDRLSFFSQSMVFWNLEIVNFTVWSRLHVKLTDGIIDERFCGCHKGSVLCLSPSCCRWPRSDASVLLLRFSVTSPEPKTLTLRENVPGQEKAERAATSGHSVRTKTDLCDCWGFHTVWPRRTHVHVGENPNPANTLLSLRVSECIGLIWNYLNVMTMQTGGAVGTWHWSSDSVSQTQNLHFPLQQQHLNAALVIFVWQTSGSVHPARGHTGAVKCPEPAGFQ